MVAALSLPVISNVGRPVDPAKRCTMPTCRYHLEASGMCAIEIANTGPRTLEEVSRHFAVSRERIRQLERDALAKLRVQLEAQGLRLEDIVLNSDGGLVAHVQPSHAEDDDG